MNFTNNNSNKTFSASKLAVGVAMLFAAGTASAVTADGTQGATSTGTADISVTVASAIIIQNIASLTTTWAGTGAIQLTDDICVGTNAATGYTITASGDGAASAFTLANGGTTLTYAVAWAQTAGQTTGLSLATTVASATQTTAQDLTCAADSATLIVDILEADLQAAVAGAHTGTLTMLVTPI